MGIWGETLEQRELAVEIQSRWILDVRNQRRYEIARDVMAALVASDVETNGRDGESDDQIAKWSVEAADALLKALE